MNSNESEIRIESGAVCVAGRGIYSIAHGDGGSWKRRSRVQGSRCGCLFGIVGPGNVLGNMLRWEGEWLEGANDEAGGGGYSSFKVAAGEGVSHNVVDARDVDDTERMFAIDENVSRAFEHLVKI